MFEEIGFLKENKMMKKKKERIGNRNIEHFKFSEKIIISDERKFQRLYSFQSLYNMI